MISVKRIIYATKNRIKEQKILSYMKTGNYEKLEKFRLADLFLIAENHQKEYEKLVEAIQMEQVLKLKGQKKIRVAFVLYSASMWSCDDLYKLFKEHPRFEPYVIVSKYTNDSNLKTWPTFHMTLQFFKEREIEYITVLDETPKDGGWKAMGQPDIVFYLTPYHTLLPVGINQGYLPAKVLTIYIPYSYMLIKAENKYNVPAFQFSWRHYCDSEIYRNLLLNYSELYKKNTFFVGYPKMDVFFKPCENKVEDLWKLNAEIEGKQKKILFTPHHSLKDLQYCSSHFSTFDKNFRFILELAKKHESDTSWILKPHPNLKKTVLMAGVFDTEQEYYDYLAEWENLPNAKVAQEGSYFDYFKTSDAMICDSVSFLAEYQFVGKPLLMLTRPEQEFNEFGELIQEQLYKCQGDDFEGIEAFLKNVVLKEKDYMQFERLRFFDENLNYYKKNGNIKASEKIFDEIRKLVE